MPPTYVILDIETIAHPDAHLWLEPVKPDARLKDPEKIAADIAEKTDEQLSRCALDPDMCRIIALGYYVVGQNGDPFCHVMRDEFEEREQLHIFGAMYNALNQRGTVRLVTFNGIGFDIPTLLTRASWLDVVGFPEIDDDKYRSDHAKFDIMWRQSRKGKFKPHSLKFYAKRAGLSMLDKVNGADIAKLVKDERWDDIVAHCLSDVGITHALAIRFRMLKM